MKRAGLSRQRGSEARSRSRAARQRRSLVHCLLKSHWVAGNYSPQFFHSWASWGTQKRLDSLERNPQFHNHLKSQITSTISKVAIEPPEA